MISSLPLQLLLEAPILGLALFALLFALFVLLFCRSDVGRFLGGMLRLAAAVVVAPVHYLDGAASRVIEYSRPSVDHRQDRQYLIRTLLLISNTLILLVAIGILAGGGVGAWRAFYPAEIGQLRAQARRAMPQAEQRVAQLEREAAELQAKLGAQSPEEKRVEDLNRQLAEAKQAMDQSRNALDAASDQTWLAVRQHLDTNDRVSGDYELARIRENVTSYVERNLAPDAAAPVLRHLKSWVEVKRLQREASTAERRNPRAGLLRDKARNDEALASQRRELQALRVQLSLGWLVRQLQPFLAIVALVMTFAAFLLFVWVAGLAVEWAGLFVDAATNIRMLRESAETRIVR